MGHNCNKDFDKYDKESLINCLKDPKNNTLCGEFVDCLIDSLKTYKFDKNIKKLYIKDINNKLNKIDHLNIISLVDDLFIIKNLFIKAGIIKYEPEHELSVKPNNYSPMPPRQVWEKAQQDDFNKITLATSIDKSISKIKNVDIYEIRGDGACFFSAVLHQIARRKGLEELRTSVIKILEVSPKWDDVLKHECGFNVNIPTYNNDRKWDDFTYPHRLRHHAVYHMLNNCNAKNEIIKYQLNTGIRAATLNQSKTRENNKDIETFLNYSLNHTYSETEIINFTALLLNLTVNIYNIGNDISVNDGQVNKISIYHTNNNHYNSYFEENSYDDRIDAISYETLFLLTYPKDLKTPPLRNIKSINI
jgi:hypothetical protein